MDCSGRRLDRRGVRTTELELSADEEGGDDENVMCGLAEEDRGDNVDDTESDCEDKDCDDDEDEDDEDEEEEGCDVFLRLGLD